MTLAQTRDVLHHIVQAHAVHTHYLPPTLSDPSLSKKDDNRSKCWLHGLFYKNVFKDKPCWTKRMKNLSAIFSSNEVIKILPCALNM